jgi:hypothetical protein
VRNCAKIRPPRGPIDDGGALGSLGDGGKLEVDGGRTGIRTQERVAPLTVFKTVAFVRSATLPG